MQKLRHVFSLTRLSLSPSLRCYPLMASFSPSKLLPSKTFENLLPSSSPASSSMRSFYTLPLFVSRTFSSNVLDESQAPAPIDYRSVLQEDEFHRLADSTIHHLLEKLEEYGDTVEVDGFDVDYGNEVLTLKLGELGTYVVNKQTPNRQIWLSSPVSGPSRFDWDPASQAWIYRRNKATLSGILESELEQLFGKSVNLF
ncbi:frataxin, mitochondrial isoform X2 [Beta vulgaris subsp. vulgaris]|uniref:frataxin, mitochondrial isoform X2 n=1 Tax=Beta vulgaris subsp. vulgaris TaxID=3555 RepID=UPI0020370D9F|nr:frataxin, mitochondrial isoform X2 [Beta vulgaris subsp. vulgaris]XP_057250847.1 frataxin, mitochondrial isoform X2 [Beta vulgaris subsp. vulgaris]